MNKNEFLRKLEQELSLLDKNEVKELLDFYQERFYNGVYYENKTEEQVISELEPPRVIARNILEQYGINPKKIKQPTERFQGITTGSVVWLVVVDLFFLSWLIPTLFGVMVGAFGVLATYIPVIALMIGEKTQYDVMAFWFLTGVFILLFHFALVILDLFMWTIKKAVKFHLDTFKIKGRANFNKKMNKVTVDGFFKKFKLLGTIKRFSFIGGLVLLGIFGFRIATHADEFRAIYENQITLEETINYDATQDVIDGTVWTIDIDVENMDVLLVPGSSDEIVVRREYQEEYGVFEWEIDEANHTIKVLEELEDVTVRRFGEINIENIMKWIKKDVIVIEVPSDLIINLADLDTLNGSIEVSNVDVNELLLSTANGQLIVMDLDVQDDLVVEGLNSRILIDNVNGAKKVIANTANGKISIINSNFRSYDLDTDNGNIRLTNLNSVEVSGYEMDLETSNGDITLSNVYVDTVDAETSNGDIRYNNQETFDVDFTGDSDNGKVSGNVN